MLAEYVDPPPGEQTGDAGDVDDAAFAGGDHRRQRGPGQLHHGGDVDVELSLQHGRVGRPELAGRAEAGIVDEHLHALGEAAGDGRAAVLGGQVGGEDRGGGAETGSQFVGKGPQALLTASDEHEVVPLAGERAREACADARGGSGDQGDGPGGSGSHGVKLAQRAGRVG